MSFRLQLSMAVKLARFELRLEWDTAETQLGLFGPSGAGKTSALEAIAGLRPGVEGTIRVGHTTWLDSARGIDLPPRRRGVGYVPQDGLLFPHLDVLGNVTAGRERASGRGAAFDPRHVLEVLELSELMRRPVGALSGGERQRVALARALCSAPDLLLLDEPLAGLDRPLRRRILPYLLRLREEFALPLLYVSHEASEVLALSREVTVLSAGRVVRQGDPRDALLGPQAAAGDDPPEVENLLRGAVLRADGVVAEVQLAPGVTISVARQGLQAGREALLVLRGEDLLLAAASVSGLSAQNDLPAHVVELVVRPGSVPGPGAVIAWCRPAGCDERWAAVVTPAAVERLGLRAGVPVRLVFKAHACRLLGAP
jgi:molybdate transport system ATP-binding protein